MVKFFLWHTGTYLPTLMEIIIRDDLDTGLAGYPIFAYPEDYNTVPGGYPDGYAVSNYEKQKHLQLHFISILMHT